MGLCQGLQSPAVRSLHTAADCGRRRRTPETHGAAAPVGLWSLPELADVPVVRGLWLLIRPVFAFRPRPGAVLISLLSVSVIQRDTATRPAGRRRAAA